MTLLGDIEVIEDFNHSNVGEVSHSNKKRKHGHQDERTTSVVEDESPEKLDKKLKRKLQKQIKKETIKREKEDELIQRFESQRSMYDLPKKLLIMDLNKVLLYRKKGSKNFIPRPHVSHFLKEMSKRFHLAIWTSMQKHSAHRLQEEMFGNQKIALLFMWFQNRCVAEYKPLSEDPSTVGLQDCSSSFVGDDSIIPLEEEAELQSGEQLSIVDMEQWSNQPADGPAISKSQQKRFEYWQRVQVKRKLKKMQRSHITNGQVDRSEQDDIDGPQITRQRPKTSDEKPIYHKPLTLVWREHNYFNESNTILVDDTEEKCVQNHEYNCIHPQPFELNLTDFEFNYVYAKSNCTQPLPMNDLELMEGSSLWCYLDELSKFPGSVKQYWETHGPYRRPVADVEASNNDSE